MAKSIRSKWKRKCRAVKRERYGKKELDRLKNTLNQNKCKDETDVAMEDVQKLGTVVSASEIVEQQTAKKNSQKKIVMEHNGKTRVFNLRSMRDQNGTFPVWMNQRHIRKQKGKIQKKKKQKSKSKH